MVEKYTGKKVEVSPEKVEAEEELKEEPVVEPKEKPEPKEKSYRELLEEVIRRG